MVGHFGKIPVLEGIDHLSHLLIENKYIDKFKINTSIIYKKE